MIDDSYQSFYHQFDSLNFQGIPWVFENYGYVEHKKFHRFVNVYESTMIYSEMIFL